MFGAKRRASRALGPAVFIVACGLVGCIDGQEVLRPAAWSFSNSIPASLPISPERMKTEDSDAKPGAYVIDMQHPNGAEADPANT